MIKLQEHIPEVYFKESRDFQFIAKLYEIVLNYSEMNADLVYNLPFNDNVNDKLIDLMATTLGFKVKHHYNTKQLIAICSIFSTILRNKGNIQSIELIVKALLHSEGITDDFGYELSEDLSHIDIFVPLALSDINLLVDLLDYVLPAGMTTKIIRSTRIKINKDKTTSYIFTQNSIESEKETKANLVGKSIQTMNISKK